MFSQGMKNSTGYEIGCAIYKEYRSKDIDIEEAYGWLEEFELERNNKEKYPLCKIHNIILTCFGCQICNE